MRGFIRCVFFLAFSGSMSFVAGRKIPHSRIRENAFPFIAFSFEKEGKIYDKLKIKLWQNRLPDMSRIFPSAIPPKKLPEKLTSEAIGIMIKETCIAEFIHITLSLICLLCVNIWADGGNIISILYIVGNTPYIIIQRYNRPKLKRLKRKLEKRERKYCDDHIVA